LRTANHHSLEKLFEQPVDIESPMSNGQSPLLLAVTLRNTKAVQLLLLRGADHQVRDSQGRSLLEILWSHGNPGHREAKSIGYLLQAGFRLAPTTDEKGQTWLHRLAAKCDDSNIPVALIEQGYSVDERDGSGWTALHHAVRGDRYDFCQGLLEKGAEVNAQTLKEVAEIRRDAEGFEHVGYRYMAGSHPLDLENQPFTRGTQQQNIAKLLQQAGGTKNPAVKNDF
jgi:ankyrin repeat protein